MAFLRGVTGEAKGVSFELTRDETTIGRNGANMLVIADVSVSAFHCAIIKAGGNYTVRDLDSTNGTKVNEEPVKARRLSAGDIVHVGNVELLLEGDDIVGPDLDGQVTRAQPAAHVESGGPPRKPPFRVARRNAAAVTWLSIGAIVLLSALLIAIVAYKISVLK
ncbi:MAG: FHA domain-containing protein [bacterium]